MASQHENDWYVKQARSTYESEGTLEFDDAPRVSTNKDGDSGAYVQCWVWVPDE
jgi:hypothetical protein